ncbi:hypothetical protein HOLleu_34290 [Holothuria leucospilota]|uniref:Uncharacterized protein n=1 Tax=Holothuria leucospilota TaxID=206669 RepID=A0A9Q0YPK2_HOLLE|nr:hypothetical protein HOLleu_34290 [Holothuria leucospilota]
MARHQGATEHCYQVRPVSLLLRYLEETIGKSKQLMLSRDKKPQLFQVAACLSAYP